jgi:hypothetical protein
LKEAHPGALRAEDKNDLFLVQKYILCITRVQLSSSFLKVPPHQIISARKWYKWVGLDEYMDRGWYTDF